MMTSSDLDIDISQFDSDVKDWLSTWLQLWSLPLRCLDELLGVSTGESSGIYQSEPFTVDAATVSRSLVLSGDLYPVVKALNSDSIPAADVRFVPASLAAGQTSFYFEISAHDVDQCSGGLYKGQVDVCADPNDAQAPGNVSVPVWILIP